MTAATCRLRFCRESRGRGMNLAIDATPTTDENYAVLAGGDPGGLQEAAP